MAAADAGRSGPSCPICLSRIEPSEPKAACPECGAEYHSACWEYNGGCAVYGCPQVPATQPREAVEIPMAYWGQEHKPCPACGAEILAAAKRCRQCGATFADARPEARPEFRARTALEQRLPGVCRAVVWLFVLSVLPCTAPLAAVFGTSWYAAHREEVKAAPGFYAGLAKIARGLAIGQTAVVVVMVLLFALLRSG